MDPLSVTFNVAALVGVAVQAARCTEKLKAIKELPSEYHLLIKEISQLHEVLLEGYAFGSHTTHNAEGAQSVQYDGSPSCTKSSVLCAQVQRAGSKLEELERSIQANIPGDSHWQEIKAFWKGMVHGKDNLRKFHDELRDIRLGLSVAMSSFTS